jgi:adenosine kinase
LDGIRCLDDEFTAGAYITTDKADNQITGFNPGAMKHPCSYAIDGLDPNDTLAIVAPGNLDDMMSFSRAYVARSIPYIFDPGQQIPVIKSDLLIEMLSGSRLFISNDYELEMIMRSTGLNKYDLLEKTQAIVTTLGDKGSIVCTREGETQVPVARAAGVLDPTGAGDAFRAGLIKGLLMGKRIVEAARMGAVSSSFSVQCQGTQCHTFTIDDFWARYETNFGNSR